MDEREPGLRRHVLQPADGGIVRGRGRSGTEGQEDEE